MHDGSEWEGVPDRFRNEQWILLDEHSEIVEISVQGVGTSASTDGEYVDSVEEASVAIACEEQPFLWFRDLMDIETLCLPSRFEIRTFRMGPEFDEEFDQDTLWGE
jgi:hypothetical protein